VELREEDIRAYTPVFLGRFALFIPYSGIARAVVKPSRPGGRVRLQRTGTSGDVTIVTLNDNYRRIADALGEKGVRLVDG
jgi:hypothetical protein